MRTSAREVMAATVAHYKTRPEIMTTKARYRAVARPRQVAMYLIRELCPHMSRPATGRLMGGRDSTTVLHGERKIAELILSDPDLAADVNAIRYVIKNPPLLRSLEAWDKYSEAMRRAA